MTLKPPLGACQGRQVSGGFADTLPEAFEEVNKTQGLQALPPRYYNFGYEILVPTVHGLCPKAPTPLLRAGKLSFTGTTALRVVRSGRPSPV